MNDSIKLLVVFMVFWAIIVILFNLLGQAIAMPEDDKSPMDSPITMESRFQNSQSNAHSHDDALGYSNKPLVDLIFMGQGFALRGNESYPLFVSIQRIRYIDPTEIRNLMSTNKSLEELKSAINEQTSEIIYDGDIKLRDKTYRLANANATKSETGQVIDADLIGSQNAKHDGLNAVKGHIMLIVPDSKDADACRGVLDMKEDGLKGTYQVLLNLQQH
jgi:hypothetical protein